MVSTFNSPLGRYSPVIQTIDGATGLFLTVKGEPPLGRTTPKLPAGSRASLAALGLSAPVMDLAAELRPLQMADKQLESFRRGAAGVDPHFRLKDGLLYRITDAGDRVVVPESLVEQLISEYHDHTGHLGIKRTLHRLGQRYWFPKMEKRIANYVNECDTCQRTKVDHSVTSGLLRPIPMSAIPWRDIAMDFLTELPTCDGLCTLLVVVDRFSKMLHLVPLGSKTEAPDVAEAYF